MLLGLASLTKLWLNSPSCSIIHHFPLFLTSQGLLEQWLKVAFSLTSRGLGYRLAVWAGK